MYIFPLYAIYIDISLQYIYLFLMQHACKILKTRHRQITARVPSVARGTIFNGTLSELKYSNYDVIKY